MKGLNGASMKCEPHLEGEFDSKATKCEIIEALQGVEQLLLSKEWNLKLGSKVVQLLQVVSMELESSKLQIECAQKEKQKLLGQTWRMHMLMEFV
jgi:hypothetical protein